MCLGLEHRVAGWKAQTNPLSYVGTPEARPRYTENLLQPVTDSCLANNWNFFLAAPSQDIFLLPHHPIEGQGVLYFLGITLWSYLSQPFWVNFSIFVATHNITAYSQLNVTSLNWPIPLKYALLMFIKAKILTSLWGIELSLCRYLSPTDWHHEVGNLSH